MKPPPGTGGAGKGELTLKIVYFSPNDTTRQVTVAAAAAMEPGGEQVDLLKAPLEEDLAVGAEEMLVVGMPVYAGRIPRPVPVLPGPSEGQRRPGGGHRGVRQPGL